MAAKGLLADNPHAAHIHFGADARHECPAAGDDTNGDGTLNTTEGGPAYGEIVVSLTKTGDTIARRAAWPSTASTPHPAASSPTSAAASRSPATSPRRSLTARRSSSSTASTTTRTASTTASTKSDLDPSLPTEATDPAICGVLSAAPAGGMDTGNGGAASDTDSGLLALGSGALLLALGAGVATTRRARVSA